jgi:trehalose 6-phosphate phosphatase
MTPGRACIAAPAWQTSSMEPAGPRSRARLAFDAAIFDLDGVVTQTVRLHALAWQQTFDDFLRRRAEAGAEAGTKAGPAAFQPFSIETDYAEYVDGRSRADGVRCFLASRGIELPEGCAHDPATALTVAGLCNRKNQIFHELLQDAGVDVYEPAVRLIRALRQAGVRVAVATSSRNGKTVLAAAGLADLFDARVDGELAAELGLAGKPSPDIFLESARRLGVAPGQAVLFEDALAGVQAGQRGGFGLVVGVDRQGHAGALRESGADVVIPSFEDVTSEILDRWFVQNTRGLPPALASWPELLARLRGRDLAVFLDYDGTLSPIVENPERAFLPEATREVMRALAARCPVAVVSGRGREKVAEFVALGELYYAGSHGFDITGPDPAIRWQPDAAVLDHMARATAKLRQALADAAIPGVEVEEKHFSTAVHYRKVAPALVPQVERRVEQVLAGEPDLQKTHGKKVLELRPRIDWHKGRAVLWLLESLGLDRDDVLPIYVGDDVTDEDALEALRGRGLGVLVAERPRPTAAEYALRDCDEVRELLARLVAYLDARKAS